MHHREIPLKIEVFTSDKENDFLLQDPKEILAVLRDVAAHKSRVAMYYNDDNSMILTLLLAVDEQGIWVDASPNPRDNRHIERSRRIVFVSTHHHCKVQWVSSEITEGLYQNAAAFYLPLPRKLLRLQRRNYYRLLTPEPNALRCIIRPQPEQQHVCHEVTIMDISLGGVALICREDGVLLTPGVVYRDCEIELPDVGKVQADIEVRNIFVVTDRRGEVRRRAGCLFVQPSRETTFKLQRYVALMQQSAALKKSQSSTN